MPFSMKLLVTATDELFDIIPQKLLYNNFYILLQLLPVKNKKRTSRGIRLLSNCDQNPVYALSSQTNKKKKESLVSRSALHSRRNTSFLPLYSWPVTVHWRFAQPSIPAARFERFEIASVHPSKWDISMYGTTECFVRV